MSRPKPATVQVLTLALKIERLRTEDPAHYRRVMRKLAQLEKRG